MPRARYIRRKFFYGGAVFLAFVLSFVLALAYKRNASYPLYNVRDDYAYSFSHANAVEVNVDLRNGQFNIPERRREQDALFLKVRLHTSLLGHFFDPEVRLRHADSVSVQTLERGAEGIRYINLSNLSLGKNSIVHIGGHYVEVRNQEVTLIYLPNNSDVTNHPRILVVAPHPDDAEIASFGLYSHRNSYIVTVTAGEAGKVGPFAIFSDTKQQHVEKGRVRVWNSLTVPLLGDVAPNRIANLGYFDGTLDKMNADRASSVTSSDTGISSINYFRGPPESDLLRPNSGASATWNGLVKDFEYIIAKIKPDILIAPYPAIDSHPDHKLSTIALIEAIQKLKWRHGNLFLYSNHLPLTNMYPFGGPGGLVSLPPSYGTLYFDGIYSYGLSSDEQKRKAIALDAMNDLRPVASWASNWELGRLLKNNIKEQLTGGGVGYLRKAVQANELFFVVNVENLYKGKVRESVEGSQ